MRAIIRTTGMVLAIVVLVGSCSGDAVPTPQELADSLIDESDLTIQALPEAEWEPYDTQAWWGPHHPPEVVPESILESPLVSLGQPYGDQSWVCYPHPLTEPAWQAVAKFSSISPENYILEVRELMFADNSETVEDAFGQLRDSLTACLGPDPAQAPGYDPASYETFEAPAVGDEQFALTVSGPGWIGYFRTNILVVRQGEIMVGVRIEVDTSGPGDLLTQDDVSAILKAAVEKLP